MKDLFSSQNNPKNEDNIILNHILEELQTIKKEISSRSSSIETDESSFSEEKEAENAFFEEEKNIEEHFQEKEAQYLTENESAGYIMIKNPQKNQKRIHYGIKALEEEAIATVTKNKKQIIKQKIIALASKNRITAKHIKEIIVDKHHYCSKATYYRYLAELKAQRRLDTITINEREYLCNVSLESGRNEQYNV